MDGHGIIELDTICNLQIYPELQLAAIHKGLAQ